MIMTVTEFNEYRRNNDHSWYEGRKFVNGLGDVLLIRDINYVNLSYQFRFEKGIGADRWVWGGDLLQDTLMNCSYYHPSVQELECRFGSMKEKF